uniref:Uncharacterized protein n=1 Tax=Steinernema glaseri TaxID=37863 RepID=A0A1I7YI17_9BILA
MDKHNDFLEGIPPKSFLRLRAQRQETATMEAPDSFYASRSSIDFIFLAQQKTSVISIKSGFMAFRKPNVIWRSCLASSPSMLNIPPDMLKNLLTLQFGNREV